MSTFAATRISLQRAALADLHPHWLTDIDAPLLLRARASLSGRRYLSRRLATDWNLFRALPASAEEAAALNQRPWLLTPIADAIEPLHDLAAMSLAPQLRAVVGRDDVLRLHRVLGERRYRDMLTRNAGPVSTERGDWQPLQFDSDEALSSRLQRQGSAEILGYAVAQLPPLLVERLRLAFPPEWQASDAARLPAVEVQTRLSQPRLQSAAATGAAA